MYLCFSNVQYFFEVYKIYLQNKTIFTFQYFLSKFLCTFRIKLHFYLCVYNVFFLLILI